MVGFDEIPWTPVEIRNLHLVDVDSNTAVEGCKDFLHVDRPRCGGTTGSIRAPHNSSRLNLTTR